MSNVMFLICKQHLVLYVHIVLHVHTLASENL